MNSFEHKLVNCYEPCQTALPCGHLCPDPCYVKPCTAECDCQRKIKNELPTSVRKAKPGSLGRVWNHAVKLAAGASGNPPARGLAPRPTAQSGRAHADGVRRFQDFAQGGVIDSDKRLDEKHHAAGTKALLRKAEEQASDWEHTLLAGHSEPGDAELANPVSTLVPQRHEETMLPLLDELGPLQRVVREATWNGSMVDRPSLLD